MLSQDHHVEETPNQTYPPPHSYLYKDGFMYILAILVHLLLKDYFDLTKVVFRYVENDLPEEDDDTVGTS
jgi:hypothetical protein